MSNIKIFVSYQKDVKKLRATDVIVPIQIGRAGSDIRLDMQGDDEGNNISIKSDRYCELTAQYLAWKNMEADYYGFMHDCRHFAFREISNPVEYDGVCVFPEIDERYQQKIGLSDKEISDGVNGYDVILPVPVDVTAFGAISNEVQFAMPDNLHASDFDLACRTVLELYPEYEKAVSEFRNSNYAYWYNMFIMKKEIFFDYCQWLFSVLEHIEEKIDFTYFTEREMQLFKYLSERLLSIYVVKLMGDKTDLKVKHMKVTFVEDIERQRDIQPAFAKNNIAVAVSCNEYYMPMLGIMLSSMLENGSLGNNYDILVLCNKRQFMGEEVDRNVKLLKKLVDSYANASLRFVDISGLIGNKEFFVRGNFTPETYFRLFLPQILINYEKVLYLDADMIICHDVAELYAEKLDGLLLGAVRDPIISGSDKTTVYNRRDYMDKLGIKNIHDYFQAGVLLMNLKLLAEDGLCDEMIAYAATHDCALVDQDVLNLFCQGKIKYIDNKWNVDVNTIAMRVVPYAPESVWKQYKENRENAYIYHFAGVDKPWKNPLLYKADIFWNAARKTPWYEVVLKELVNFMAVSYRSMEIEGNSVDEILPTVKAYNEISALGLSETVLEKIKRNNNTYQSLINGKYVIFYGAGYRCKQILLYFDELGLDYPAEIWDMAAKPGQRLFGVPVCKPDFELMKNRKDAFCVVAIESKAVSSAIKQSFAENGFTNVIENGEIMEMLSEELWLRLEKNQ